MAPASPFIRDTQITVDMVTGDVYVARHERRRRRFGRASQQQNLQVHRRWQHLDQHVHRPQLLGRRPRELHRQFGLLRLHV